MRIEALKPEAAKLTASAVVDLDQYNRSRDFKTLEVARVKLEKAVRTDPEYLQALYYQALVSDLVGRASEAIPELELLIEAQPHIATTIKYNLALAYFHRYNRPSLREAARHLRTIVRREPDLSLRLLAEGGLARTYAMSIIPADPRRPNRRSATHFLDASLGTCESLRAALRSRSANGLDQRFVAKLNADILNARATSSMYYSDFFWTQPEKEYQLHAALRDLVQADRFVPRDWANRCNQASAYMRLGHWTKSRRFFSIALKHLKEVTTSLRPNYGFAFYESGRVCRLMGDFRSAIGFFEKARKIPYELRDVSDRRIDIELERARSADFAYP
jgi:tetratricopeptide (TPR) repeat protein